MNRTRKLLRKYIACILAIVALVVVMAPSVSAYEATNYSYTISAEGEWIRTQDAYLTSAIILKNAGLNGPEDMTVKGDELYIADTNNKRIYIYNMRTKENRIVGEGILSKPTGVFVNEAGDIYVADNSNYEVYVFATDGSLKHTYKRPQEATFGSKTEFRPSKIAVNPAGILYIVSDGSYDGMVQIDAEGNFLGYFGYNNVPMSIGDYLQDIFFTEAQKSKLFDRVPMTFSNLAMDDKGLVYSITQSVEGNAVKRHNVSGQNLLPDDMDDEQNFLDIAIGNYGQIYAVTQNGLIFEYDTDGNLLFSLGGWAISQERGGIFNNASSIAADDYGNVYVLDSVRNTVHALSPTAMATAVHSAMDKYNQGFYEDSKKIWEHVSLIIGNSRISENGIANCLYQLQDYEGAADHYYIAENRSGYSDAYWQIRSDSVTVLLPYILGVAIILAILLFVYKRYRKTHPKKKRNISKFESDMRYIGKTIKHPLDSFYSIRRENVGSFASASVIYLIGFIVFIANFILRGFVISTHNPQNTSILYVSVLFLIPVTLFIISNFLVGEINESEARFRDIYVATAYVMSPFIAIMPFIIAISHFLTEAESSLLGLASVAIYSWVAILLWISTKEIHAYTVPRTIANLLITIFLILVIIIAGSLLIMFWDQLVDFVYSVIKEVQYRVTA